MAKKEPKPETQTGGTVDLTKPGDQLNDAPYNPATDPNKTAQERLDALVEQQEASRRNPPIAGR